MSTLKYRRRIPKALQQVLNTKELHRTFHSQLDIDSLNKLINDSLVIVNSTLPIEVTAPTVLSMGLDTYVKKVKVPVKAEVLTLKDVVKLFLIHSKGTVTPPEYRRRELFFTNDLHLYFKDCGIPTQVDKITSNHLYILSQYMGAIKVDGVKRLPQTVNRIIKTFKSLVSYGHSTGLYTLPNTMPTIPLNNRERGNREPLTAIEYDSIIELLTDEALVLLNCTYYGGLRPSEVYKSCINIVDEIICFDLMDTTVKLKTVSSYRVVPLHNILLSHTTTISNWNKNDIRRLSLLINKAIHEVCIDSGKSLYSARHSFVTFLLNLGCSTLITAELAGHSRGLVTTLNTYFGGSSTDEKKRCVELL